MKSLTKTLCGALVVFSLSLSFAFAQENDIANLKTKVTELRTTYTELKAQVQSGKLSIEEARTQWKELINEVRTEKENVFKARLDKAENAYQTLLEKNPERAALLKERIDAVKSKREAIAAKRTEVNTQIKNGTLSRQEGQQMKIDFIKSEQARFMELRNNFQDKRNELETKNKGTVQAQPKIKLGKEKAVTPEISTTETSQ